MKRVNAKRALIPGVIGTLIVGLLPLDAAAQGAGRNCAPREIVVGRLADKYGETRQSIGLGANNSVIEVYASTETGTWTILMTMPNGISCLMATGSAFEATREPLAALDTDA